MLKRYLTSLITRDLPDKMLFIGGPRQAGKTTLAVSFLQPPTKNNPGYMNWDFAPHRKLLLQEQLPHHVPLIILDEIHKYKNWRRLIKGYYDIYYPKTHFIVTGSAKLDHYRKDGDSLIGRYFYYRLHPFSLREMTTHPNQHDLETLLAFSGFPEPLFKKSTVFWRRWQRQRLEKIIYGDLRDLETVRDISLIELLVELLPSRVGSPLSIKSLKEDLQVSHETVEHWLTILEKLYISFRIPPYGSPKIRAVKKEQKLYLWDWTAIDEPGARFENLVACQLLKYCHFIEDSSGEKMELRFLRDIDKREIDFVVLKNKHPLFAVECKTGEKNISPHLQYFKERTKIPKFYQVHLGTKRYGNPIQQCQVLPFIEFCKLEDMP